MVIAIVGAGGKTTICNHIGKSFADMGHRVLFTTTTKIFRPTDNPLFLGKPENIRSLGSFTTAAKRVLSNGKLDGYTPESISAIERLEIFDDIIVEADGAARKSVKAPNETEPVYPICINLIIGVIGLDCIGKLVNDQNIHRASLFSNITQAASCEPITVQQIIRLIEHPEGLFRHAPLDVPRVVFLNKYDKIDEQIKIQAEDIIRQSPLPVILTGYNIDWFDEFFHRFLLV